MFDLNTIDFEKIIEIVKEAAQLFGNDDAAAHIKEKGQADFVTEVDMAVQTLLCSQLQKLYPDIQFMGEEKDNSDIDFSKPVWILDPVDGTTNLIFRFPESCISLGFVADHQILAGIIYNPYHDELFFTKKGEGAYLNGRAIHVRSSRDMSKCLIGVGTSPYQHELSDGVFRQIINVFNHAADIRRLGSAAMDLAYVACGRTDAFFELVLRPWDFAAGQLLVEEAGGRVTDFSGNSIFPEGPTAVLASNGLIHDEMIELLRVSR